MNSDSDGLRPVPQPERFLPEGVATRFVDGAVRVSLTVSIYPLDAILRTCYWMTERGFFYIAPMNAGAVEVTLLSKKDGQANTDQLVWDFLADLVDQSLRLKINAETRTIRELIVAQAFSEADLIDDRGQTPNPTPDSSSDPRGVTRWRTVS